MTFNIEPGRISGLPAAEQKMLADLLRIFRQHEGKNALKARYYEGDITLGEVNLGLALPKGLTGFEIGCEWGGKAVDVLAGRSMFDGFVGADGQAVPELQRLVTANALVAEYKKHCRDELTFGCTFATLSKDDRIGCRIRFHTPRTSAARWNGERGRIDCGFAIIDVEKAENESERKPRIVNLYTDTDIWVMTRSGETWSAQQFPHIMGRPLMVPLIWGATSDKPFGQSRINDPVRRLIQSYVRTVANATIGLEFCTAPQKYLLGVTDDQYDAVVNDKFRQYVGSIITATTNPDTGEKPTFGQLPQGSIQPHVEMLRMLATQFAAATGLSVSDTGVVNDANPTSYEALRAQTDTLVGLAEDLNTANGDALRLIGLMALAIEKGVTLDELSEDEYNVVAHFRSPGRPNVAASADAATKIATVRPAFADTDVFLEMMGFDQADVRRIKAQELRVRGLQVLGELTDEDVNAEEAAETEA